jgi:hypothetical protein
MAKVTPSRISAQKIMGDLRLASKKGDRAALSLALDQMRTLAHSPKYWEKYLGLLRNPHQKGWKLPRPAPPRDKPRKPKKAERTRGARARAVAGSAAQISLFE